MKHMSLGKACKRIVLYSGNQIVVFYGSNSWAYTRLGRIEGMTAAELKELLGNENVTLTIATGPQNDHSSHDVTR